MSDSTSAVPVTFFKRTSKGASKFRKRAPTPPPANSDSDSDSSSDVDTPGAAARPIKKRKTGAAAVTASSSTSIPNPIKDATTVGPTYSATSRNIVSDVTSEATKSNYYEEMQRDLPAPSRDGGDDGGTYKGTAGYGSFISKNPDATRKKVGPLKAATNVRTITITDYAPDVCKDYKQTGFCGFGDTCKFLHAREDYAAGWKLDREWELGRDGKRKPERGEEEVDDEWKKLKDIPFKCVICKGDYKDPVITKCGHYFCETCAIKRYKKNPGCAICGKRTDGVFNVARGLRKKLERKMEREEERRRREEEEREEEEKGNRR